MGIRIKNQENVYLLSGKLTSGFITDFNDYFNEVITNSQQITINIEQLSSIDRAGVNALVKLYSKSLEHNIQFYIIGFGSKDMHDHLRTVETAA